LQENADSVPLVLGLACRHSHLGRDLPALCSLLRVSKAVQQAVLDKCSGPGNSQLQILVDADASSAAARGITTPLQFLQKLSHQAKWLAKHGRLVKLLSVNKSRDAANDLSSDLGGADEAVMSLAVRPPVQLQNLDLNAAAPLRKPAALLTQLDGSHLTQLQVSIPGGYGAACLPAALQQLTGLSCLVVTALSARDDLAQPRVGQAYAAAMPSLTNLTELRWCGYVPPGVLQQLPHSVVRLQLQSEQSAIQHLAGLHQLQQLKLVVHGTCDATALAPLTALTSLQRLGLRVSCPTAADVAQLGRSWAALPALQLLRVLAGELNQAAGNAIAAATSVTKLQLRCLLEESFDLAAMIAPLAQLKQLCVVQEPSASRALSTFGRVLSQGITHLVWCGARLAPVARTQLSTCTQLRALVIDTDSIGDDDLEVMGHYLKELQLLGVVVGGTITLQGLCAALTSGGFAALRKLVAARFETEENVVSRAEVARRVAVARPDVRVEHLKNFGWSELLEKRRLM
jgi:hypothetical protein